MRRSCWNCTTRRPAGRAGTAEVAGRLLVLGSGSNVLIAEDPPAWCWLRQPRHQFHRAPPDHAMIRAGAGVPWHGLVMWSLQEGLSGLENWPDSRHRRCRADPEHRAYGAQVGEFIQPVEAWDTHARAWVRLDNAACRFGYRDSVFKQQPDRYLITAIELSCRCCTTCAWTTPASARNWPQGVACRARGRGQCGDRDPPPQAARPGGARQRRQFLQEPGAAAGTGRRAAAALPRPAGVPAEQDGKRKVSAAG
jgi:UDP-N-acetylmuramate dehydrogenase